MDEIDLKLLRLLQKNARTPIKALAGEVRLSSPAVSARIERLEKQGVIRAYTLDLDPLQLGHHILAYIHLDMQPTQKEEFYPFIAAYSAFSIYVQYHAKAEILFDVPADCFVPKPKVDSAVLKLVPLDKPAVETKDEKLFFSLVRAAFNMRRKTLVNALGPVLGSSMSKEEITALVEAAGLDARVRGERLSLAEYAKLADLAAEKLSN